MLVRSYAKTVWRAAERGRNAPCLAGSGREVKEVLWKLVRSFSTLDVMKINRLCPNSKHNDDDAVAGTARGFRVFSGRLDFELQSLKPLALQILWRNFCTMTTLGWEMGLACGLDEFLEQTFRVPGMFSVGEADDEVFEFRAGLSRWTK